MATTLEAKVKAQLKEYLDKVPRLFYYSAAAGAYSTSGIPDIIGCHEGEFFAIEVKAPGRRKESHRGASALQVRQMNKIFEAYGKAIMFDGGADDWTALKNWIDHRG